MKKSGKVSFILVALLVLLPAMVAASPGVVGLWKTIDDETGDPKGVVAMYEYRGKIYGRVICSFDESGVIEDDIYRQEKRSPYIEGNPPFSGLDIIWDMKKRGDRFIGGKIMDPGDDEGNEPAIYDCELWREGNSLIVRGKILFFGRNQTWYPMNESEFPPGFVVPDYRSFVPKISEIK